MTHYLVSWLLANAPRTSTRRDRALVTLAGVAPDLDGLGAPVEMLTRDSSWPLLWFSDYHHVLAHNATAAVTASALAAAVSTRRALTASLVFLTYHLHLLGDIAGGKGPDGYAWPIPYLEPWSDAWQITWSGQWELDAWPNFVVTFAAVGATLWLGWRRGFTPLEHVSARADLAVVDALRKRFGPPRG